jgi:hypothetical protein
MSQVDDLTILVRRLVHALKTHEPDSTLARQALDYIERNELKAQPRRVQRSPLQDPCLECGLSHGYHDVGCSKEIKTEALI